MYTFLFSRRWLGWLLLVGIFAAGCVALGNWQMDRRDEARADIQRVENNYERASLTFAEGRPLFEQFRSEAEWTTVAVQGTYLVEDQRIVRNRPLNGRPGYEVLVPFRLVTGETLVINRGWLPIGNRQAGHPDSIPAPPAGEVSAVVRVKPAEPGLNNRTAPEGQLATIELDAYAQELGYPIFTASYGLLASESPAPETAPQQFPKPALDEGPHLSYSMQWFAFGVLMFIGFGYAARQQARFDREEREDREDYEAQGAAYVPRERPGRQRRHPTAEEEEDALLDAQGY